MSAIHPSGEAEAVLVSPRIARCPRCGRTFDVLDRFEGDPIYDGELELSCHGCGEEFDVLARVTFEFTSPPMKVKS